MNHATINVGEAGRRDTQDRQSRFYMPELDGLRFFAFFAVFIAHTVAFGSGEHRQLPNWIGNALGTVGIAGAFGVDLFFTLSSFLITSLLLSEFEINGSLHIRQFYIRRALRIWPVYFLVTLLAWIASFFVAREVFPLSLLFCFTFFIGNWAFIFAPVNTVATPLWSVSVEEQFYLAWPWLVGRSGARGIRKVALAMLVMGAVTCVLAQWLAPASDWVTKNTFARSDGIAIGALLAIAVRDGRIRLTQVQRYALLATSIGLLLAIAAVTDLSVRPIPTLFLILGWFLVAVACGGILASVIGCEGALRAVLTQPALVYLGRISYGLYAYHEFALRAADDIFPDHFHHASTFIGHWVFSLLASLLIAAASYRFLETPFLRLKGRFTVVQSRPD